MPYYHKRLTYFLKHQTIFYVGLSVNRSINNHERQEGYFRDKFFFLRIFNLKKWKFVSCGRMRNVIFSIFFHKKTFFWFLRRTTEPITGLRVGLNIFLSWFLLLLRIRKLWNNITVLWWIKTKINCIDPEYFMGIQSYSLLISHSMINYHFFLWDFHL